MLRVGSKNVKMNEQIWILLLIQFMDWKQKWRTRIKISIERPASCFQTNIHRGVQETPKYTLGTSTVLAAMDPHMIYLGAPGLEAQIKIFIFLLGFFFPVHC